VREGENGDPDRNITNARPAVTTDGLLTTTELGSLFAMGVKVRSMYDEGLQMLRVTRPDIGIFGERIPLPETRRGIHEPEWTCYTHYWKTVLGELCTFF